MRLVRHVSERQAMNEHDRMKAAFVKAIQDRPDDESCRLVYADWCDENGECALAKALRTCEPNFYSLAFTTVRFRHKLQQVAKRILLTGKPAFFIDDVNRVVKDTGWLRGGS